MMKNKSSNELHFLNCNHPKCSLSFCVYKRESTEKLKDLNKSLDDRNSATKAWIQSDTQCRAYANQLEKELKK